MITKHDLLTADKKMQETGRAFRDVWGVVKKFDLLEKNELARIKYRIRARYKSLGEKVTEASIEDEARSDKDWEAFEDKRNKELQDYGDKKLDYEMAIAHYEAIVSFLSYEKKEMELAR